MHAVFNEAPQPVVQQTTVARRTPTLDEDGIMTIDEDEEGVQSSIEVRHAIRSLCRHPSRPWQLT